jgi:hypothetical protein
LESFKIVGGMNWGCLSFLILFPTGIFIWAAGERRRRAALPPDELKKLEDEEDYGPIDEKMECIFCHSKNCVRTRHTIHLRSASFTEIIPPDHPINHMLGKDQMGNMTIQEAHSGQLNFLTAHCMNCTNDWEMFPPDQ